MNIISERMGKDDRHFELVEDQGEILRDLFTYFPKLMEYLWKSPKIIALVIQNTEAKDVKEYLAPLFSNNFYENILSSSYIEDNLMYLLTLLIDGEIKKLTNINQIENFLEESQCGYLLGELRKKNDIQAFFKSIISDSLENLENNHSSLKLNFNINKIYEEFKYKLETSGKDIRKLEEQGFLKIKTDGQYSDSLSLDDDNEKRNKKQFLIEQENFNQKYVPPLNKKALQTKKDEFKDNKKMQDFLYSKLNDCDDNENKYSNHKLMGELYKFKFSPQLLLIYQKSFMVIVNFIDSILEKIIINSHKVPYSAKCLSKIILLLIKKKFPSITETEKFFFGKLFIPILKNPAIEALINNLIISGNTLNNLKIISNIIKKFTSGNFYLDIETESEYTPFNWYFIEKMEKLFEIFDNITKVTLPPFIVKFINGELASDYEYDYFKENQDQVIIHRSMCFNLDQIKIILKTMEANKDKIFINPQTEGLKKTVEKILYQNNMDILNNILKSEMKNNKAAQLKKSRRGKNDIPEQKPKVHYFLFTSIIYNEKYEKLFNIKQVTNSFSIKELKVSGEEESSINKNNIIRVKNFICSLLYNYNYLLKTDFNEAKIETTEEILKELPKSSNSVMDGTIPSEWYVTSLLEYLKKIPEDLTKNDCEKLYNEIETDLRKSIKELDLEALSVIMEKLKFAKRGKNYYEESKRLLNDINLNEDSKNIIENEFIPVEIKFIYDEDLIRQEFEIIPSRLKEKDRDKINESRKKEIEKKANIRLCTTIDEFTRKFPNLLKFEELQDVNIFELQEHLGFPAKINNYLRIVRQNLEKKGKNELDLILEKIYDYVMIKLYDKIYPAEPREQDSAIFQQSIKLSWTEPKHYLGKKKYVFGSFITDTTKYFNLINLEKSPKKKVLHMSKIFDSILLLLKFNGKTNDIGVDDQMPILNYAIIKAQPFRLYSDAKFMDLYIGGERNKFQGNLLTQFIGICDLIPKIDHTKLYSVERAEYIKNCNDAISHG